MTAPRRLGPWLLRDEIAAGPFSVTFRAEHEEIGRAALIKTLKPTVSPGGPLAAGLEREARILSRLQHPNIIAILDVRREGGALALVLEPLTGPTLADLLARAGRLEPEAAAAIALEIARGLGHAHERGVTHAALTPEHVTLTPEACVKITELSAAHDARPSAAHAAQQPLVDDRGPTEPLEALSLARLDYMAPEQILGDLPRPPLDVFALGVILFEMLTGERPFDPEDAAASRPAAAAPRPSPRERQAQSVSRAVAHRIRHERPRPLRALAPEIPRALEQVVLRSLEKEPDQRYADGRAVAAALEEALTEIGYAASAARALITRALTAARIPGAPPASLTDAPASAVLPEAAPRPRSRSLGADLRPLLAVLALIVLGGAFVELGLRERDDAPPGVAFEQTGASGPRGHVRVLARPWAEVILDGELVDVTPIGRPIPVVPGRHYVTFRHPNAPEEKREIVVAPGQTVLVDVTLRVDRAPPDAGLPPDAGDSP